MRKTVLFLFMMSLLFSCGAKEVKQASQESKTAQEAFALAETLRNAFTKNDVDSLQKNSTQDGYKDIMAKRKSFDAIELTFTPRWVEIDNNQVLLNVAWKSVWTSSGKSLTDRGMAVFVMEGRPLKLTKILRANPFAYPEQ